MTFNQAYLLLFRTLPGTLYKSLFNEIDNIIVPTEGTDEAWLILLKYQEMQKGYSCPFPAEPKERHRDKNFQTLVERVKRESLITYNQKNPRP